jgi:hypothetical protein
MNNIVARWNSQPNLAEIINFTHFLSPTSAGPLDRQPWYFEDQTSLTASTISFSELNLHRVLSNFASYLIENSRDIEPEYVRIVEENFWDLLA